MNVLIVFSFGLISLFPAHAQNHAIGRVVSQVVEDSWSRGWVAGADVYTSVFYLEKTKPSYLILVGERHENRDLQVRYWVLPSVDRPESLKEALNRGFDYHFADYPTGLFRFDGRKMPLLNKGPNEKLEVTIKPSYEEAGSPNLWVAFGGEGLTMTLHPEQTNSEVGQMASMLVEAARQDHANQGRWYRRISPLWGWGTAFALAGCFGVFMIYSRGRR